MLLTVDVGNSSAAAAVFRLEVIVFRGRVPTPRTWPGRFPPSLLPAALAKQLTAAIVSSVVPRLDRGLSASLEKTCRLRPLFLTPRTNTGIPLKIDRPAELGADRIANCVGALTLFSPPLIVIDSGTAITFDLVNRSGEYCGGCIMPGIDIAIQCLAERAAKLRRVEFKIPPSALGRNTADSIRAGLFYGYIGALQHLISCYRRELGRGAKVVATGGLIRQFKDRVAGIDRYAPDLIFQGLRRIHEELEGRGA